MSEYERRAKIAEKSAAKKKTDIANALKARERLPMLPPNNDDLNELRLLMAWLVHVRADTLRCNTPTIDVDKRKAHNALASLVAWYTAYRGPSSEHAVDLAKCYLDGGESAPIRADTTPTLARAVIALDAEIRQLKGEPSEPNQNYPVDPKLTTNYLTGPKLTTVSDDVARIAAAEKRIEKLEGVVMYMNNVAASTALDRIDTVERVSAVAHKDATEANRTAYEAKAIALRSESLASNVDRLMAEMIEALRNR